ncbi:SMP-30/gluconolactonase/LRE family protein [Paenibacillus sp. N4]|uniref:YIP1 family protein n=1 Tax=Paenibacillus vietnamensis TaxID=2590547 RepID=UPI001CD184E3|nr:YIP1 family protein [Paenibacillus vietnamensis]MCA0758632.1 SMP-30/gluconolactonase/LRE family protein [Paenibacillus vietnamensis]
MKPSQLNMIRLLRGLLAVCLVWVAFPAVVSADYPYSTNYKSGTGSLVWTQAAFAPEQVLGRDIFIADPNDPSKQVQSPLAQPRDLFIDSEDRMYVADSGNNRIVLFHPNGEFDRILPALEGTPLSNPQGLFVDGKNHLYVADTGNARVVMLDRQGKLLKEYKLPESRFIPEDYRFEPIKVAVDKRGFLYIVSLGSYNGLLQLDPEGGFVRFFAANKVPFTVLDSIKRMFYSKEMYEKQLSKLPPAINNVNIDDRGFTYTVSFGEQLDSEQVKKLNNAGKHFLGAGSNLGPGNNTFGEYRFRTAAQKANLKDIAIDASGNFSVIDGDSKMVSQYDAFGNLLFFWSGDASPNTTQLGIVKSPAAIDINSKNELFILDDNANLIQTYHQTEFGALVYKANNLTVDGRYKEAEPLWREVLHLNAYYAPAMIGLAQSAYASKDFAEAKKLFLDAGIQEGFSNAFWKIRLQWFQDRFGFFMNVFLAAVVVFLAYKMAAKRFPALQNPPIRLRIRSRLLGQLKHSLYVLRHPIDGFSALRYENKGSYLSAFIILALAYISYAVSRTQTSFTFNMEAIKPISGMTVFLQFFLVWIGWVVSNYLVSSILRGEGRFMDVFVGSAYALTPFIVVGLPLTLISNGMSLSEASIYNFLHQGMMVWIFLLLVWKVQSLQNYSVGETVINLLYTAGTMIVIGVLCFILFGLSTELRSFIYSIVQEVSAR